MVLYGIELELKRFCGKLWTLDGSWPASAAFRGKSVSGDSSKVGPWQIGLDWGSRFDWGSGQGNGFGWALWSLAGSMHSVSARFRGRLALAATAWPVTFVAIWFCLTLVQPSPCGSNRKTSEGSQPCWKPDWSIFRIKGPALTRWACIASLLYLRRAALSSFGTVLSPFGSTAAYSLTVRRHTTSAPHSCWKGVHTSILVWYAHTYTPVVSYSGRLGARGTLFILQPISPIWPRIPTLPPHQNSTTWLLLTLLSRIAFKRLLQH